MLRRPCRLAEVVSRFGHVMALVLEGTHAPWTMTLRRRTGRNRPHRVLEGAEAIRHAGSSVLEAQRRGQCPLVAGNGSDCFVMITAESNPIPEFQCKARCSTYHCS